MSEEILYLCSRKKKCNGKCHYPECKHTSDVKKSLNYKEEPSRFELYNKNLFDIVNSNGTTIYIEKERSDDCN